MTAKRLAHLPGRQGTVVVMFAMVMVVVVAVLALSIDVGYIALTRTQLQSAADSAALAGADALNEGPAAVRSATVEYGGKHQAAGRTVLVDEDQEVVLGQWNEQTRTFTALSGAAEQQSTAVQVECGCSSAKATAANLFFARIFGKNDADVFASAIAYNKPHICGRFVGLDWVNNENGEVDSYNSDLGAYNPASPGSNGHVCSNGPITNKPAGVIRGNATPGPGYSVTNQGIITGSQDAADDLIKTRPVDPTAAMADNNNSSIPAQYRVAGGFQIGGSNICNLPAGVYYFSGNFLMSGSSQLVISGKTTIYVDGNIDLAGGPVTNNGAPSQLTFLTRGTYTRMSGSGTLRAVIYGPTTNVEVIGSYNYFGAIVAKSLSVTGDSALHYDEALNRMQWLPKRTVLVR